MLKIKKSLIILSAVAMLGSTTTTAFAANNTNTATTVSVSEDSYYSEENIYNILIGLKEKYPEGTRWENDRFYPWTAGLYSGGYGCVAFAFEVSDICFGKLPARFYYNLDEVRVGDILRINNDTHSVVVLKVEGDTITITEGSFNSSVHWGRTFKKSELASHFVNGITRYPKNNAFDYVRDGVDYSPVFNPNYYAANNPDVVAVLGNNPDLFLTHFILNGMKEGRAGNATFNVENYKNAESNKDLRQAFADDTAIYYIHYCTSGKKEGRQLK